MADKEEKKNTDEKNKSKDQPTHKKTGLITWIIMAVIIVALTASGYVVGKLFAGSSTPAQQQPAEKAAPKEAAHAPKEKKEASKEESHGSKEGTKTEASNGPNDTWYYDLDPIVANLNEPGAMRYIRVSITLQINSTWPRQEAESILEMQKPNLRSSLAIYLASLTTDDATGDKNLKRIQLQILDTFNEILFPDSKPQIKQILFKEGLAIQ
jgi:flagellar basal body-associated protein FliL